MYSGALIPGSVLESSISRPGRWGAQSMKLPLVATRLRGPEPRDLHGVRDVSMQAWLRGARPCVRWG